MFHEAIENRRGRGVRTAPEVGVIAYQEVPNDLIIDSVVMLQFDDIIGQESTPESQQLRGAA